MKIPIVYAAGETVFDIIFKNFEPQAAKPGGSAFNALISLGRLGVPCSFISEVGNDRLGSYIRDFLSDNEVDNKHVIMFDQGKSALSLAFLNESSDAEYDFYKDYPNQRLKDVTPEFTEQDYFLFGSFYGLNPAIRPQMKSLIDNAKRANTLVYYDPNFRAGHLDELQVLMPIIEENFQNAHIVRASDEDLKNIYNVTTPKEAWKKLKKFTKYFIYTANAQGIDLFTPEGSLHVEVDRIEPISTIGAGDTFNAGVLYGLYNRGISSKNIEDTNMETWQEILETAASFSKEVCLSYDNYVGLRS